MAVNQHQFYLDRKQSKSALPCARSVNEIAADLCISSTSLQSSGGQSSSGGGGGGTSGGADSASRSNSTNSLSRLALSTHGSTTELTVEDLEASRQAARDMHAALKARREALEALLAKKTDELRDICLKEGSITGSIPSEYPRAPGEPPPSLPRRVGTEFSLSPDFIYRSKETQDEEMLTKLELDYEIQAKITEAALKLAKDPTVAKSVRKKRKQSYHKSSQKLKDIEMKLNDFRQHRGRDVIKRDYNSADELSEDSREFLDSDNEILSPDSPQVPNRHTHNQSGHLHNQHGGSGTNSYYGYQQPHVTPGNGYPRSASQGQVEVVELEKGGNFRPSTPSSHSSGQRSGSPASQGHGGSGVGGRHPYSPHGPLTRGSTPSPGSNRRYAGGPSGYHANTSAAPGGGPGAMYRNASYPNFSSRQAPQYSSQQGRGDQPAQNGPHQPHATQYGSSAQQELVHNMYNLNLNKMSSYNSTDELKQAVSQHEHHAGDQGGYGYNAPSGGAQYSQEQQQQHKQYSGHHSRSFPRMHDAVRMAGGGGGNNANSGQYYSQHHSLERERHRTAEPVIIPELTPSKFGSKRESHSDYRDSPYNASGPHGHRYDSGGYSHSGCYGDPHGNHSNHRTPQHGHGPSTAIPFIDSSQSSLSSASSNYYHELTPANPSGPRQQNPPSTPQFETPPVAFIRQESPLPQPHAYPHSQTTYESPEGPPMQPPGGPALPNMTVTKYSNYVELSKPFEMADVYKYSEKIRKTRNDGPGGEGPQSPTHSSASGGSSQRAQSPFLSRTVSAAVPSPPAHLSQSRSRSASPLPPHTGMDGGHYGSSQYGAGAHQAPRGHMNSTHAHKGVAGCHHSASVSQIPSPAQYGGGGHSSGAYLTAGNSRQYHSPHQLAPPYSGSSTPHRSLNDSGNASFGSYQLPSTESSAFRQEMLAWYDDRDQGREVGGGEGQGGVRPTVNSHQQYPPHTPTSHFTPRHENSTLV